MSVIAKIFKVKKEEVTEREYYAGEDALAEFGIKLYIMETLTERIEKISPIIEELKKIDDPDLLIHIITVITNILITPFLRAGSDPRIGELLKHFFWILDTWYRKLLRIVSELDVSEEKKKTYRRIILCAIKEELLPLVEILWAISFREEDIVPKIVNIIQQPPNPPTVLPMPSTLGEEFEKERQAYEMEKKRGRGRK